MLSFLKEHWIIIVVIVGVILLGLGIYYFFFYTPSVIDASMLRTSVTEQNKLKQEEGYESTVYADTGGKLTVGYGHTGSDVDALGLGASITSDQGLQFFNQDLYKFEKILNN